jgi:transcription antitermination protein NusB
MSTDDCCGKDVVEGGYTRSQVRSLIFHVLYCAESYNYEEPTRSMIEHINEGYEQQVPLDGEIAQAAQSIIDKRTQLDDIIRIFLKNWRLERLGVCTKLILRMGIWEMLTSDTSENIVINESIELAKDFGEKDAYKFINGILDQVAERREEFSSTFS